MLATSELIEERPLAQQPPGKRLSESPTTTSEMSTPPASNATEPQPTGEACMVGSRSNSRERDSSWLELEVCREHIRQTCPRQAEECRYAHPEPRIYVKDGRVTCCYDFLKVYIYTYLVFGTCSFFISSHRIGATEKDAAISILQSTLKRGWYLQGSSLEQ